MYRTRKKEPMALTCSLLGHAFDDYEVVRDREERGSEVVTSIREVAVCDRCGAERVLSENTEVTSIVDADAVDADHPATTVSDVEDAADDRFAPADDEDEPVLFEEDDAAAVDEAGAVDDPPVDGAGATDGERNADEIPDEGAELVESEASTEVGGLDETAEEFDEATATEPADEEGSDETGDAPEDDDAVILTDAPEDREYGEWPAHDDQQYRPWDPDRLLDGPDDEDDEGPTVAEMMGTNGRGDATTGTEAADDAPEFEETAAVGDGETILLCRNCGFQSPARAVSLRKGDACPDCHTGYLVAERNP